MRDHGLQAALCCRLSRTRPRFERGRRGTDMPTRRTFLGTVATTAAAALPQLSTPLGAQTHPPPARPYLKTGAVTYNIAKDWDLETILRNLAAAGIEGVELRTTHAHGDEISLPPAAR